MENKNIHEPLFQVFKRTSFSKSKSIILRIVILLLTFFLSMCLASLIIKQNLGNLFGSFFEGIKSSPWKLFLDCALLLGFGVAIVPAFKMKYWNMGANGQVMMGALISVVVMFYMGNFAAKSGFNNFITILIMFVSSMIVSVIWAVIPAIFKVFFKTNETLFTLMMNYIAAGLIAYTNYLLAKGRQLSPGIINQRTHAGWLPQVINQYFIPIVVVVIMAVFIYIYMAKTKHGYEVTVVGDSEKTARYVGMHTKKVIIRTLVVNGILCGILGFLYASNINHSMHNEMCGSLGFTAVLVAWLSNFNPLIMAGVSLGISMITNGINKVCSQFRIGNTDLSNIIIGLIFFSILVTEFIIRYQVRINKNVFKKKENKEVIE